MQVKVGRVGLNRSECGLGVSDPFNKRSDVGQQLLLNKVPLKLWIPNRKYKAKASSARQYSRESMGDKQKKPPSYKTSKSEGDCLTLVSSIQKQTTLSWEIMVNWKKTIFIPTHLDISSLQYCKQTVNGMLVRGLLWK